MDSSLDISNNVHSNSSFMSEDRSPGSSPGVTIQPINYVSSQIVLLVTSWCSFFFWRPDWNVAEHFTTVMRTMTMSWSLKRVRFWWCLMSGPTMRTGWKASSRVTRRGEGCSQLASCTFYPIRNTLMWLHVNGRFNFTDLFKYLFNAGVRLWRWTV